MSIPSPASLRPGKDGSPSVQARRWASYVGAVVDYIQSRYHGRLKVELEAWNEPNLTSGLNHTLGIPGAARTVGQAVSALHTYESIARDVIRAKGATESISLGSSALFTRANRFSTLYLKAHNRKRRIDSIHVNVYGFKGGSATSMTSDWDARARKFRARVAKLRKLRALPLLVTEANLNLVNRDGNVSNLRGGSTRPSAQRRLATATQMNAYYRGYSAVYWLIPWRPEQAAVHVQTTPGNAARDALAVLQSELQGHRLRSCSERRRLRTCRFTAPEGATVRVLWRTAGSARVRLTRRTEVVQMTGAHKTLPRRATLRVTTTPIVLR